MKTIRAYQEEIFQILKKVDPDFPETIEKVYFDTPRHQFVDKFLQRNEDGEVEEITITPENLDQHLAKIYKNHALGLFVDEEGNGISSVSQPTLVLMMLQQLDIQSGHKVLEIGTASGWNAAMMGKLVGEKGVVHTSEIISDLAVRAKAKLERLGINNVKVIDADGANIDYEEDFDRIMFTVGSYDIPKNIYTRLKDDGILLMVLKNKGGFDSLILFRKKGAYLEAIESQMCWFVPLTGAYAMSELNPIKLDTWPLWASLKENIVVEEAFWWGGKSGKNMRNKRLKLTGITSFLSIVEPQFEMFELEDKSDTAFGLIDVDHQSLVIWRDDKLIGYGNLKAYEQLKARIEQYTKLGMPSSLCFQLKVYPKEAAINLEENQWLVKRKYAQLLWSI